MLEKHSKNKISFLVILFFFIFLCPLLAENPDELYREGRYSEALKEYQKADMDDPKDLRFRYNRGCAAFQNSDFKGAEAAFSSVLRRAEDNEMRFKASYNLGNVAHVQNDFAAAAEFYKQALIFNPESKEAKSNLELSLKKLADAKKQNDNQDNKDDKKKKDAGKKDQENKKGTNNKQDNKDKNNNRSKENKNDQKDLSGDIQGDNSMGEKPKEDRQISQAALLDKKKAEALLDNIKENRAKILQFQMPKGKKEEPDSGKNW